MLTPIRWRWATLWGVLVQPLPYSWAEQVRESLGREVMNGTNTRASG